jgi:hypothetical protein
MHIPVPTSRSRQQGLAAADLPKLPIFCSAVLKDDDAHRVSGIDFWDVASTGDEAADVAAGDIYADIAIRYARQTNMPAFIYYVAAAIEMKIFYGIIERGPMETAFLGRIGRDGRQALQ